MNLTTIETLNELPLNTFFVFYALADIEAARRRMESETGRGYWKPRKEYKASTGLLAIEVEHDNQ